MYFFSFFSDYVHGGRLVLFGIVPKGFSSWRGVRKSSTHPCPCPLWQTGSSKNYCHDTSYTPPQSFISPQLITQKHPPHTPCTPPSLPPSLLILQLRLRVVPQLRQHQLQCRGPSIVGLSKRSQHIASTPGQEVIQDLKGIWSKWCLMMWSQLVAPNVTFLCGSALKHSLS